MSARARERRAGVKDKLAGRGKREGGRGKGEGGKREGEGREEKRRKRGREEEEGHYITSRDTCSLQLPASSQQPAVVSETAGARCSVVVVGGWCLLGEMCMCKCV